MNADGRACSKCRSMRCTSRRGRAEIQQQAKRHAGRTQIVDALLPRESLSRASHRLHLHDDPVLHDQVREILADDLLVVRTVIARCCCDAQPLTSQARRPTRFRTPFPGIRSPSVLLTRCAAPMITPADRRLHSLISAVICVHLRSSVVPKLLFILPITHDQARSPTRSPSSPCGRKTSTRISTMNAYTSL